MPIEQSQVLLGGAVVFWRLASRSDRQRLFDALASHGLDRFCPEPRTPASALKEAVSTYSSECHGHAMVRGLKNSEKNGFLVVHEQIGDSDNTYRKLFSVKVNDSGFLETQSLDVRPDIARIEELYNANRRVVTSAAVAGLLVDLVEHYRGTPLRPNGGFYWIESGVLPDFVAVAGSIEQCAVDDTSAVHFLKTAVDNLSVRALKDAIVAEVQAKAREIEDAATEGTLKSRGFKIKQSQAQSLHERVSYFENLLGEALSELHEVADNCEKQVVENALQAIPDFLSGLTITEVQEVG